MKPTYNTLTDLHWDYQRKGFYEHQKNIIRIELKKKEYLIVPDFNQMISYEESDSLHYEEKTGIWWSTYKLIIDYEVEFNIEIGIAVFSGTCHIKYP